MNYFMLLVVAVFLASDLGCGPARRTARRTERRIERREDRQEDRGVEVVIVQGHVHSAECGHYTCAGKWYLIEGHHHGSDCGHEFVNGIWILKE